ncbi:hypothetical protein L5150_004665 [Vibrio parahaemolyticus]|uniref:hypothetical protein n=1 Tax=Vibrio vulnificus TaxID=672 RepID=UPI00405854C0|nr:hypothetical protein [Vibrio parahaemolyticus]EIZ1178933.1 hypothetical protein [Vibrio parahaemolyticus]EJE8531366.1 hypothetical protein [Vibrio parahaemolyticus]EJG1101226.1 hypothetical protein [Vibrio parahaemolyticus]
MEREIFCIAKRYNSLIGELRETIFKVVEISFDKLVDEFPRYYPKSLYRTCTKGSARVRKEEIKEIVGKHKDNLNEALSNVPINFLSEDKLLALANYPIIYTKKNLVEKAIPPKFQSVVGNHVRLLVDEIACLERSWLMKDDNPKLNYLSFYGEIFMTQDVIDLLLEIKALESEHRERIAIKLTSDEEQRLNDTMSIWENA